VLSGRFERLESEVKLGFANLQDQGYEVRTLLPPLQDDDGAHRRAISDAEILEQPCRGAVRDPEQVRQFGGA
jgi:hypothetical protein